MNNRNFISPILLGAVFSFLSSPSFLCHAEPGVPSENTPTHTPPAAPAPAAVAPAAPAAVNDVTAPTALPPSTYTVVSGDSLWLIAQKFNCSIKSLKKLNNLTKNNLKPGQVLKLPTVKAEKTATPPVAKPATSASQTPKATTSSHHKDKAYAHAQPVQDFDIPASTFASCPVPMNSSDTYQDPTPPATPAPAKARSSAPVAELVSPAELTADSAAPAPSPKTTITPSVAQTKPSAKSIPDNSASVATSTPKPMASSASKQLSRSTPAASSSSNLLFTTLSNEWQNRFMEEARKLANMGIDYDESWRPPGESSSWAMDCSNTSRYLYKATTGLQLPRTASDQYYYLHLQNKAWDIPDGTSDVAECNLLRENLKPGDLLFWENTYKPERQPPITHVMVYLGTNEKGQWIMAGSQTSRGGEHNRPDGGPDIYVFDPTRPCGGYTTWLGFVHHKGRFCAYGRPLDADPSKLAVAANN